MSTDPIGDELVREAAELDAVFVDRDGTLTVAPAGRYLLDPDELRLSPGAAEAVVALNRAGVEVHVVTNQRGVALGLLRVETLDAIHDRLRALLAAEGAVVDSITVCPHDEGRCECRKPADGLLRQVIARRPYLEPGRCAIVGDAPSDVEAGRRLGVRGLLLPVDAPDLRAAVHLLLGATTAAHNTARARRSAVACAVDDSPGG